MPTPATMFRNIYDSLRYNPCQIASRPSMGISPNPMVNTLGWAVGLLVACGIVIINSETRSDLAPTLLYITLLLMAANLFSINLVITVALMCMFLLTAMFLYNGGYHRWDSTTGFFRCLTALSAIAFLALRSKQASDSLRHNEAYLVGAQRLSQTGSFGFRGDRSDLSWSEESARIFEYPCGKPPTVSMVLERTHPEDLERLLDMFGQAARREPQIEVELRLLMPDGRVKHIHMIASLLPASQGRCQYLGALMDMTASKEAEAALFRAQAQLAHVTRLTSLGEMAASIAHEVNQPLTAITSSAQACRRWLERPEPNMKEALDSLERIVASSRRASEVIDRIRALSRKCDPRRQAESLDEVVHETLNLVQQQLVLHKVTVKADLASPAARVSADRVQLQQVIINLVINACHAMDGVAVSERVLQIRTWIADNEAILDVTDQGTGIAEDILPSLFTPFFTTRQNGLGMGLAICRSIIEFHDGRIWATSEAGRGTSFRFALPLLP
nr:ATP-binding protein [Pseudomonas sp. Pf153]